MDTSVALNTEPVNRAYLRTARVSEERRVSEATRTAATGIDWQAWRSVRAAQEFINYNRCPVMRQPSDSIRSSVDGGSVHEAISRSANNDKQILE